MRGLYLITNDDPLEILLDKLDAALATGQVAILQYRRKKVARSDQPVEVEQIKQLCEKYQTPFVINDNLQLASQLVWVCIWVKQMVKLLMLKLNSLKVQLLVEPVPIHWNWLS